MDLLLRISLKDDPIAMIFIRPGCIQRLAVRSLAEALVGGEEHLNAGGNLCGAERVPVVDWLH
jgi:hypothetical protein